MGDFQVQGQTQSVVVKPLKDGLTLKQAETQLKSNSDGYDTIGFSIGDQAFLAYGKGLKAENGQTVTVDGQKGTVQFFEDEDNSFTEGVKGLGDSWKGALAFIGIGSTVTALESAAAAKSSIQVAEALFGFPMNTTVANRYILRSGVKTAALTAVALGATMVVGSGVASMIAPTSDRVLQGLTK